MAQTTPAPPGAGDDPYLWLEEVEGGAALNWVRARNADSLARLEGDPRFDTLLKDATALYTATDRIPYGIYRGGAVRNFWQDGTHIRGILRRTGLQNYSDAEPDWETVLDIDALADEEGENWVYAGSVTRPPEHAQAIIYLSRGGGDAVVAREFDLAAKTFVADGFTLPEGKQWVVWLDADTLLAVSGHGGGAMNSSGYPRTIRRWRRGTPVDAAEVVFEAPESDAFLRPVVCVRPDGPRTLIVQLPDFYHQRIHVLDEAGQIERLALPEEIEVQALLADRLIFLLREDWQVEATHFEAGSAVSIDIAATLDAGAATTVRLLAAPPERGSVEAVHAAANSVYVELLDTVTGKLVAARPDGDGWRTKDIALPAAGSLNVVSCDDFNDVVMVNFESFLMPRTLYLIQDKEEGEEAAEAIKAMPARIDPEPYVTEQHFATSADGTQVPYFLLRPKTVPMDGSTPTLLYGYGGFEISLTPSYVNAITKAWLERGGAAAIANIRGGGEFGPAWHQAALKENRQRAYDDFIAVGEHLIESGLTSPRHLGIHGGSNGGLLVGVAFTQRPELFAAVACSVPLLDMLRYHKLLAGASWVIEYGDPDVAHERAVIEAYSPYQNLDPKADYPEVFFTTSTRDDRVHPGHARKMVARMAEQGHDVLYFENIEGGHAAAADLNQLARRDALTITYFLQKLTGPPPG